MAAVISFCGPWALGAGTKGPGNRGAKRGHKEAQGKPRTGSQGGRAQEGPGERAREGWPRRGLGGVGPRAKWALCYLRLSDNCCCHVFFFLLSWLFWLAVDVIFACCHWFLRPMSPGPRSQGTRAHGAHERGCG